MYGPAVRVIVWSCFIFYLFQHIYFPLTNDLFGLAYIGNDNFQVGQFLTHGFLHGTAFHICVNMLMLILFGGRLELTFGPRIFLVFFFLCVIGGGIFQTMGFMYYISTLCGTPFPDFATNNPIDQLNFMITYGEQAVSSFNRITIGASGGVYGCLVAFAYLFSYEKIDLLFTKIDLRFLIYAYLGHGFYLTFSNPFGEIAHFAHIGGALVGLLFAVWWNCMFTKKT